jgi:phage terminase small subunit
MRSGPKATPKALQLFTPTEPPAWCGPEVAERWWNLSRVLIDRGALTRGDLPVLESFLLATVMVEGARKDERWRDCDKFMSTQARLGRELGLTISARETMRPVLPDPERDDLADFKSGA